MKVGDLLVAKHIQSDEEFDSRATLIITEIKEHHDDVKRDKLLIQWMPVKDCKRTKGEFLRHVVEQHYKVLSNG